MDTIIKGIILGLSITAPIGPTNIELIRRGIKEGWLSAVSFWSGVLIALIIYLFLIILGFSYLAEIRIFKIILLVSGLFFLIYLSFNSIKDFFYNNEFDFSLGVKKGNNFIEGILLTLFNPAVLLLWTSIMGADLAVNNATFFDGITLSIGILIGVIIFFIALTFLIHFGRNYLSKKYFKYVSLAAGLILTFFCIKFGIELVKTLLN